MATNQQNNEEEVDLGSLFVIIGKGFSKLFNFIGNIFKGIFHFIISILLFLKENIIKIAISGIIGLVVGIFLEVKTPKRYTSDLLLQPNFESSRQLYNNVNFYNDLVMQKDTSGLEKTFGLDEANAVSLKKFKIEPIRNENDIISRYNDLVLEVDTLTIKSYDFENFKASFTDLDYKIQKVTVIAEKNDVFKNLDETIISSIENNKYFKTLKKLTNENLNRTDSIYRQSLSQVDSLRGVYMQVMLDEAKKTSSGTSIDLGGTKKTTKEIELFETSRKINLDLRVLANEKSQKYEVINIVSNFQPIGNEIGQISKNKGFLLAVLGISGMIFILLLLKLNVFLNNYKR